MDFLFFAVGIAFGAFFSLLFLITSAEHHNVIIEKGYGLYCPDTGNFAFIGECE